MAIDHAIFAAINGWSSAWLDTVLLTASQVGRGGFVWLVIAAVLAIFPARRPGAWRWVMTLALTSLVVNGIAKPLVWRDRPFAALPDVRVIDTRPPTSSFPSGHAAEAVAGAMVAVNVLPAGRVVWWTLAALIAVSRVYVGVHFPTDVLAGALAGYLCARLTLGGVKLEGAPFEPGPVGT